MDLALLARLEGVRWDEVGRAADLGCGTGRTGQWLRAQGVGAIDGIDLTPEMLEVARGKGVFEELHVADVAASGLPGGSYGLVTCCLVDEHLADLAPLYREAARLLAPGASFVLVGYHPFFMMAVGMPTHFDHPVSGPLAIETHVHLFEEHVAAAGAAGLVARELREGVVDDEWIRLKPRWAERRDWPVSFAWRWRSPG